MALAYTEDSRWRNRAEFLSGQASIIEFLRRKWARELDYRLIKEVWTQSENRLAVRFAYEWHDDVWQPRFGRITWPGVSLNRVLQP